MTREGSMTHAVAGLPVGVAATLAVILEVTAPKPGNVHRGADFEDVTYLDFLLSAAVVAPILERTAELSVGGAVLDAVRATKQAVGTNTNLGTLLLIAPLTMVPDGVRHADGIGSALSRLNEEDTRQVYEAIRISSAGGLGRVDEADVSNEPPPNRHVREETRQKRSMTAQLEPSTYNPCA